MLFAIARTALALPVRTGDPAYARTPPWSLAALDDLLGAPLRQAVGVAIMLYASAQVNAGFFDPSWMDQPQFAEVLSIVPREDVVSVIDAVFANSFDDFKRQAAEAPPLPFLDRYMFNPLTARPLVRLGDGRLLAPVPHLIARKLSPMELYYLGIKRWGEPFARDMGELFEDYVGRQLGTLPDVTVELWFLLHFQDQNAAIDRHDAQRKASEYLNSGKTPTSTALAALTGQYEDARRRAQALDRKHELDGSPPRSNPSSEAWRLIETTRQAR